MNPDRLPNRRTLPRRSQARLDGDRVTKPANCPNELSIRHVGTSAIRQLFVAMMLAAICVSQVAAPEDTPPERIQYTIELKDAAHNLVHVRIELPPGVSQRDLQLPVWNATYMV